MTKRCWNRISRPSTDPAASTISRPTLPTSSPILSERSSVSALLSCPTAALMAHESAQRWRPVLHCRALRRSVPVGRHPSVPFPPRTTDRINGRPTWPIISTNSSTGKTAFWVRAISTSSVAESSATRTTTSGRTSTVSRSTSRPALRRRRQSSRTHSGLISPSSRPTIRHHHHRRLAISSELSYRPSSRRSTTTTTTTPTFPISRARSSTTMISFPTLGTLPTSIKITVTRNGFFIQFVSFFFYV
ncbi:hypothetical protein DAPPUDRAFT_300507 [Daphnia pulex]|uniref:Uncharacterized protein n=1 Tax=Daphnia pulex TaxID=6669 RepID=E9HD34_DAPPU|nr:hypothetical protein DAPPUDRAFT_300507 [Daphnia pulex]|eukprot:EFX70359.1 hypothetical protein DAPPUDRAFT_300507 [Daphnia pulex]